MLAASRFSARTWNRSADCVTRSRGFKWKLSATTAFSGTARGTRNTSTESRMVLARQAVVTEPFQTAVREVELPDPAANQILLAAEYSAISAGTELAVYTGTHQWLKDPAMTEWKFPFRSGYSAAGRVLKVGKDFPGGFKEGDRVSFPGNHASAELLTVGQERCRVWRLPDELPFEKAAVGVIARYGLGASVRAGITRGR